MDSIVRKSIDVRREAFGASFEIDVGMDVAQKASYLGHLGKLFGKKKDKE